MKALHLNLATRPHRDNTSFYTVVIVLAVLCALLLVNNLQAAYRYLVETKETRAEIARVQAARAKEESAAQSLEAAASRIDLKTLSKETAYINEQIADRAFSWSRLLDDLEGVVPKHVRLATLNPSLMENGDVQLTISAAGKSHNGMIDFLDALQKDPKFDRAFPQSHAEVEGAGYAFALTVTYLPDVEEVAQ